MNVHYQGIDYKAIISSGVIAGLVVGVLQIGGACCWPVDAIVLLAAGALAVHLSGGVAREHEENLINGALAGLLGGVIGGIIETIMYVFIGTFFGLLGSAYDTQSGAGIIALPLIYGTAGLVCCMPTFAVGGAILGGLGAYAYRLLNKQSVTGSA